MLDIFKGHYLVHFLRYLSLPLIQSLVEVLGHLEAHQPTTY